MFATALTPISAAANAVGHVRKKRNAPVGDISISPFTWMSRPANALASWSTHQSSRRHSGKRSEEHTSELQSPDHLVCRLLLEKKNTRALIVRCGSLLVSATT